MIKRHKKENLRTVLSVADSDKFETMSLCFFPQKNKIKNDALEQCWQCPFRFFSLVA